MDTIIFDMDGTLIDSSKLLSGSINYVREAMGLESLDSCEILSHINNPDINPAKHFYLTDDFTAKQSELFCEYYDRNCTIDISLYEGIFNTLETLSLSGKKMAVATNASSNFANMMLDALDIHRFFEIVVGADMVKNPKPEPDMLLKVINSTNSNRDRTVLIGDSPKDMLSAKSAKIEYLLVDWGFSRHSIEEKVVYNAKEILKYLKL